MTRPLLLFVVTEDRYFLSHRLPMARAAQAAGFDVAVAARVTDAAPAIEAAGVRVLHFAFARGSLNPLTAFACIVRLTRLYRHIRPAAVHHIAMQPVLYGAIAAWLAGVPRVINAFAGLGYVFTARDIRARSLRALLLLLFRLLLRRRGSTLLLQNDDDRRVLAAAGAVPDGRTLIIPGSGVELDAYRVSPLPPSPPFIVAFSGRMIAIKGLSTLQASFAQLATSAPQVVLWLCGAPDAANPGAWDAHSLRAWADGAPNVVWRGQCRMADIWPQAHAAVQPSWGGEGVPKALLEAAACGRPLIATDVAGCRDVVQDGVNGRLVPPRDAAALALAIERLAVDPALCRQYGVASRARVETGGFSAGAVERASLELYRSLLTGRVGEVIKGRMRRDERPEA